MNSLIIPSTMGLIVPQLFFKDFCGIKSPAKVDILLNNSGVVVIVVGNGHGDTSSNPGRDWWHFT